MGSINKEVPIQHSPEKENTNYHKFPNNDSVPSESDRGQESLNVPNVISNVLDASEEQLKDRLSENRKLVIKEASVSETMPGEVRLANGSPTDASYSGKMIIPIKLIVQNRVYNLPPSSEMRAQPIPEKSATQDSSVSSEKAATVSKYINIEPLSSHDITAQGSPIFDDGMVKSNAQIGGETNPSLMDSRKIYIPDPKFENRKMGELPATTNNVITASTVLNNFIRPSSNNTEELSQTSNVVHSVSGENGIFPRILSIGYGRSSCDTVKHDSNESSSTHESSLGEKIMSGVSFHDGKVLSQTPILSQEQSTVKTTCKVGSLKPDSPSRMDSLNEKPPQGFKNTSGRGSMKINETLSQLSPNCQAVSSFNLNEEQEISSRESSNY